VAGLAHHDNAKAALVRGRSVAFGLTKQNLKPRRSQRNRKDREEKLVVSNRTKIRAPLWRRSAEMFFELFF